MIFVTGGTGLLGAHLLYKLALTETTLLAAKRPNSNVKQVKQLFSYYSEHSDALFEKITWLDIDLLDTDALSDVLQTCTSVYHCAAFVSFNPKRRNQLIKTNAELTASIVNACLTVQDIKLCHVSSVAALGNAPANEMSHEETKWTPSKTNSAYSISKHLSEMEVWRGINEGLKAVIVNPSIILGAGNWQSGSSSFFDRIFRGMNFYTEGVTGYVGAFDVAEAMIRLSQSEVSGERFLLNAANLSYLDFFSMVAKEFGKKAPQVKAGSLSLKIAVYAEKIRSTLTGKDPQITKESIRSAVSKTHYSSDKFKHAFNFNFQPINNVVAEICAIYLKSRNTNKK